MRYSELERLLMSYGCRALDKGARHQIWFSPITGKEFPVPRHKTQEVPKGTLRSIKRDAGIP